MNEVDSLALFQRHDHAERWESPPGFDRADAIERFHDFALTLDTALGALDTALGALDTGVEPHLERETGMYIQDASFHSQINLGRGEEEWGWLRFSSFGEMVAITPDYELDDSRLALVHRLCVEKGYTFVPTELLEQPYTGSNPGVSGIRSWWVRFFDWV